MQHINHSTIFILLSVIILVGALMFYALWILPFLKERAYIKMEIERATNFKEREHWEKELKMLYTNAVPFIRRFIK